MIGKQKRKNAVFRLVIIDSIMAMLVWYIFWYIGHFSFSVSGFTESFSAITPWQLVKGLIGIPAVWFTIYLLSGTYFDLYRKSRLHEINRTLISCILGSIIVSMLFIGNEMDNYSFFVKSTSRYLLIHTLFTLFARLTLLNAIKKQLIKGHVSFNTVIIGTYEDALSVYTQIKNDPAIVGNKFLGYVCPGTDLEHHSAGPEGSELQLLGSVDNLVDIIEKNDVEEIIIAFNSTEHKTISGILTALCYTPVVIKVLPDLYDIISGFVRTSNVYDTAFINIYPDLMPDWQRVCKRMFDILVAGFAMLLLLPLYLFAAMMVRLSSRGTIFYKQERIGLYGKPFNIYKFRSMYMTAEVNGPALSKKEDPRITPWGRVMRKWRIDEIPQFYNILVGDMSLVGPRPERKYFIDIISVTNPHYKFLHKVKPGLTSWGMVKYGYAENVQQMVSRMRYDLLYIENCSLALDLKIMLYTIKVILQGRGK